MLDNKVFQIPLLETNVGQKPNLIGGKSLVKLKLGGHQSWVDTKVGQSYVETEIGP